MNDSLHAKLSDLAKVYAKAAETEDFRTMNKLDQQAYAFMNLHKVDQQAQGHIWHEALDAAQVEA